MGYIQKGWEIRKELLETAKPILFNTEMVKAITDGRKVQTRTAIYKNIDSIELIFKKKYDTSCFIEKHSKYKKGDVLYVRETFCPVILNMATDAEEEMIMYRADEGVTWKEPDDGLKTPWKPSIHMPKKYARLFLKVTDVRVERLQDISIFDAIKEGISEIKVSKELHNMEVEQQMTFERERFSELWDSTAKDGYKWEDNPYVFVYEFEVIK